MFSGARLRLTALLASLFLVLYLVTAGSIYAIMYRLTVDDENAVLLATARPLASDVLKSLNHGQFPREFVDLKRLEQLYPRMSAIVLRDAMGDVLAGTNPKLAKSLPYTYRMTTEATYLPATKMWGRMLTIHFTNPYGETEGSLQLVLNINHDLDSLARLREVMLIVGVGGTLIAILAAFLASHRALQPIARAVAQQERFVADASHELRTPLAVIQANLDVVLAHADEGVLENLEWLSNARSETARLTRLTTDLLTLARADSNELGGTTGRPTSRDIPSASPGKPMKGTKQSSQTAYIGHVAMRPVITEVYESLAPLAALKNIKVEFNVENPEQRDTADQFTTYGEQDRLHQLMTILLDNAIKYTPAGGRVRIRLERRRRFIRILVEDTGIGIAPADIQHIFERFYRSDEARARSTGGSGLGLSIAEWIVSSHHGKISAHSALGEGSAFIVLLPAIT